jgi:predicted secreted protein
MLLAATMLAGCATTSMVEGPTITVECADFEAAPDGVIVRAESAPLNSRFMVALCSNPSTGFSWEDPTSEGDAGIEPVERTRLETVGGPPGSAGQERFTFDAVGVGSEAIHFAYSQLALNVD